MIHHAWSVIAEKFIIDSQSNNISLDVVESFQFFVPADAPEASAEKPLIAPLRWHVVSLWYRDGDEEETGSASFELISPSGKSLAESTTALRLDKRRLRSLSTAEAFPITGGGVYTIVVRQRVQDADQVVARLPLEVEFTRAPGG